VSDGMLRGSCLCGEVVFEVDPRLARWVER
jgi:hypothetical protein